MEDSMMKILLIVIFFMIMKKSKILELFTFSFASGVNNKKAQGKSSCGKDSYGMKDRSCTMRCSKTSKTQQWQDECEKLKPNTRVGSRSATTTSSSDFNCQCYLNRYDDLKKAFGNDCTKALAHYNVNGNIYGTVYHSIWYSCMIIGCLQMEFVAHLGSIWEPFLYHCSIILVSFF